LNYVTSFLYYHNIAPLVLSPIVCIKGSEDKFNQLLMEKNLPREGIRMLILSKVYSCFLSEVS